MAKLWRRRLRLGYTAQVLIVLLDLSFIAVFVTLLVKNKRPEFEKTFGIDQVGPFANLRLATPFPKSLAFAIHQEINISASNVFTQQQFPVSPDEACLFNRKGTDQKYAVIADYGNREVIQYENTRIAESACVNATPTNRLGNALGCPEETWPGFLCATEEGVIVNHCPTWDEISQNSCTQKSKCCDKPYGFVEGINYTISKYTANGYAYVILVNQTGFSKVNATNDIILYAAQTIEINTPTTCSHQPTNGFQAAKWSCSENDFYY